MEIERSQIADTKPGTDDVQTFLTVIMRQGDKKTCTKPSTAMSRIQHNHFPHYKLKSKIGSQNRQLEAQASFS